MSRRLKPRNSTAVFISASFPWINTLEWEAVYDWLYSEELKLRKRAVGRVAAWKARASIPLCIELTADLVEGGIWELQHHVRGTTEQPLTLMYSMALTRFTNGVSELAGGKFAFPTSDMVTIVGKLNVPSWVVELRHDGTHAYLPSLSLFHKGAQFALGWLKTFYWEAQRQLNAEVISPPNGDLKLRGRGKALGEVNSAHMARNLRMFSTLTSGEEDLVGLREELLVYMGQLRLHKKVKPLRLVKCLQAAKCRTLTALMEEGLLLAFPENIECLVVSPDHFTLEDLPVLLVQPAELSRCWVRVLRQLGQQDCQAKSRMLNALVAAMHGSYCSQASRELLAAWAGALLAEHEQAQLMEETELMFPGIVEWEGLLATLSENPGLYSYPLVLQILKHHSLPHCAADQIIQIMKLVTCSERGVVTCSESGVATCAEKGDSGPQSKEGGTDLAQLETLVMRGKRKMDTQSLEVPTKEARITSETLPRRGDKVQPARDWEQVEDPLAWLHCPLGVCPGQVLTPSLLDLPDDLDCITPSVRVPAEVLATCEDTVPSPSPPVDIDSWPQSIPVQDIGAIQKGVTLL